MRLEQYLLQLFDVWARAGGRAQTTLGVLIANDGKLYGRLEAGRPITTALFQTCLAYFRDPANWPDGMIPGEALALLDNFSAISSGAGRDPGAGSAAGGGPHPLPLAADETQGRAA